MPGPYLSHIYAKKVTDNATALIKHTQVRGKTTNKGRLECDMRYGAKRMTFSDATRAKQKEGEGAKEKESDCHTVGLVVQKQFPTVDVNCRAGTARSACASIMFWLLCNFCFNEL